MTATIGSLAASTNSRQTIETEDGGVSKKVDTFQTVASGATTTLVGTRTSAVADDAAAVAFADNTSSALSTAGAKLARWLNNAVEKAALFWDGAFRQNVDVFGSYRQDVWNTEAVTLNTGATANITAGNLAPANSRIKAILIRVTTTITTAVSFTVKVTAGNNWKNYATGSQTLSTVTAGTTYVLLPNAFADDFNSAATTITLTTNANPGAGAVRITTIAEQFSPPTS